MNLIKDVLLDQEFYTSVEQVDDFLDKNKIDSLSVVQQLMFDKSVFKEKSEAIEWATTHYFCIHREIEEIDKTWVISQFGESEFISDSLKTVELRRGVNAVIGILRLIQCDPFTLSLRNDDSFKFVDGLPHIIELAKVIKGFHATYGEVEITKEDLKSFVKNFNEEALGIVPCIDFDHETREAAGWIKSVWMDFNETVLYGEIKWTPKGALALKDREFRYFSPEFTLNYTHPHTGKAHGPTLLGGALVNRPFLKMDPIVELKNKQEGIINMDTISMKEHNEKVLGFEKQISDLKLSEVVAQSSIKSLKEEKETLDKKVKELKATKEKMEKESLHKKLFDEQKINKAQLDALNGGKNMLEVLALSEKMNPVKKGGEGSNASVSLSEKELKMCKKLGITPEEYVKYNPEDKE